MSQARVKARVRHMELSRMKSDFGRLAGELARMDAERHRALVMVGALIHSLGGEATISRADAEAAAREGLSVEIEQPGDTRFIFRLKDPSVPAATSDATP